MKNSTKKIEAGMEVTFDTAYGVNTVLSIKGDWATVKCMLTKEVKRKKVSGLKAYVTPQAYWDEQELAAGQAIHKHGDTVYSILCASGNGGRFVWDDVRKEVVPVEGLTKMD